MCEVCGSDLDDLGLRPAARYCCTAHKARARRERVADLAHEAEAKRERTRAVRRAAAARRKRERARAEAEDARQRMSERAELERLRRENELLRDHAANAVRILSIK